MEECPKTADEEIVGKTCDRGSMIRTKIRRMGGIVVFIGFVLLIPSFIGMGIGGLGLLGSGFIASQTSKSTPEVESDLRAAKVPEPMIIQLIEGAIPTSEQLSALPPTQMLAVQKAQFALHGKDLEPGILVGGCVAIIIASLVGGLLGWLLVMKKWVLRCTHCRAVLPAA